MQITQRLDGAKGHKEWLIQKKDAVDGLCKQQRDWLMPKNTIMDDTTKDAVDGLCKQHRDWMTPKGTMNG